MKINLFLVVIFCLLIVSCGVQQQSGPYMATGIKIGEVSQSEAIIWVRLTKDSIRVADTIMPIVHYKDPQTGKLIQPKGRPNMSPVVSYPEGYTINNIEGACPGAPGKIRIKYKIRGEQAWEELKWLPADPEKDYTIQTQISGLKAGESYELLVEAASPESNSIRSTMEGSFKTAPAPEVASEVNFIVTTGTSYPDVDSENGYKLYPNSLKLDPEFFVHTGDIIYFDYGAKNYDLARWYWDRMYSLPNNIDYHRQVASYFIKDDHDTFMDDAYPGMKTKFMGDFTFDQGIKLFLEEVPMGDKTYRTRRWGKDLQIWMVEGRDYRSKNNLDDGPEKTIWGKEQMEWFKSTVKASDATYKILISPTPVVGPDRVKKNDNHANTGFTYEGDLLREFISQQKNMYIICGDRHWQYISKHIETGVVEFSCGPGSDAHAGGWPNDKWEPEHIYLNVVGGFLEAEVSNKTGSPQLTFRHYNPDGVLLNEYDVDK